MLRWAEYSGFCGSIRILLSDAGSLDQNKTKNRITKPSITDLIV
jgi:hypothetical protein